MKKILFSVLALAFAAYTFTSCEDVPAPYEDPNNNTTDEPTVIEPEGDGTEANPYNVAATIDLANQLSQGEETDTEVYIKGIVTDITENYDGGYGNATYSISDDVDATNSFYIYRSKYFNNTSYSSGQTINYGDTVVVYGKLTNYNGTLETVQNGSYLVSINGVTGDESDSDESTTGEAEGDGTETNPFNAVAAYQYAAALEDGDNAGPVYIKGFVSKIEENYDGGYGNATYWISDDGTFDSEDSGNQFYIFRSKYLNDESYSSGDLLSVGDEVVVYGTVTNYYGNTPETVQNQSYLYSLNKGDDSDDETSEDISSNSITVTASSFGLDNETVLETLELSDGTTLTFEQNGGYNEPKFYTTGSGTFRLYPSNSITIASTQTIVGVKVVCDEYNGTIYNASGDLATTSGTISTSDAEVTVSGASTNSLTLSNTSTTTGAQSQLRIAEITVYYAE